MTWMPMRQGLLKLLAVESVAISFLFVVVVFIYYVQPSFGLSWKKKIIFLILGINFGFHFVVRKEVIGHKGQIM